MPLTGIQTVLCPVDFSAATSPQLELAADLCRLFGARLVLHHNLDSPPPGAGVGWMWASEHNGASEVADEERMRALVALVPADVRVEARITHGLPTRSVLIVAELEHADVVVLTTHGDLPTEHMSVTRQVLERSHCAVLVLHEPAVDRHRPHFVCAERQAVLVPTDFGAEARPAIDFAFELGRRLDVEVHLLHVAPAGTTRAVPPPAVDELASQLSALVPADGSDRARVHVVGGDPADEIAAAAERLGATCIVMGEHTRAPLRRWLTRDTSRAVLERAHCPVWYVPAAPPVATSRAAS